MMAAGRWTDLPLWTVLLWMASHFVVEALRIQTVKADPSQCGSSVDVRVDDVYRVIMPERQQCPSGERFSCSIRFERALPPRRDGEIPDHICVDYSRIRLYGANTTLTISTEFFHGDTVSLTEDYYPVIEASRAYSYIPRGRKCFNGYRKNVTLTFEADCSSSLSQLRDKFSSWIYMYTQPYTDDHVFYLDGTCKHETKSMYTYDYYDIADTITVRSIYWKDTASEPRQQTCSLLVDTYRFEKINLCLKWVFKQSMCEVSVRTRHVKISLVESSGESEKYKCLRKGSSEMDTCFDFAINDKRMFDVFRNESLALVDVSPEDGALLFEVTAIAKKKKKYDPYDPSDTGGYQPSDSYDTNDSDGDEYLSYKLLFPAALLFSVCACVCGVARKKSKTRNRESMLMSTNGHAGNDVRLHVGDAQDTPPPSHFRSAAADWRGSSSRISDRQDWRGSASRISDRQDRRNPSSGISEQQNWRGSASGISDGHDRRDAPSAPPPSYGDLNLSSQEERLIGGQSTERNGHSGPAPRADNDDIEPPPLFSDGPPEAPPAYDELYPANT